MVATLLMPSSLGCESRLATPRTDRPSLGPAVAEIASALGTPFMPWQQQVASTALELREDGSPAYRRVVLTVPRQSGKTTLILATFVHRALAWGSPQVMAYAAQTGVDARKKFVDDQMPILKRSPFRPLFRPRLTSGHEAILWKNGSRHGIVASTEKTGHGPTLDLAVIDEAFSQPDARLEQAFSPAMITRRDAQLWVVSTAGTPESVYLKSKVDQGRRDYADTDGGIAYFEWSAPENADPEDPATWWACMPAMGFTVTEDVIRAELAGMPRSDFCRAYLNQWDGGGADAVIPADVWSARVGKGTPTDPVFALDVAPLRSMSAIAVCGDVKGRPMIEVTAETDTLLDHRAGTDWLVPRMLALAARYKVHEVYLTGTAAESLRSDLERGGLVVTALSGPQLAQACGLFYDAAIEPQGLIHSGQQSLDRALAAARRNETEHGWSWARKKSGDITPLVAATVALWAHTTQRRRRTFVA